MREVAYIREESARRNASNWRFACNEETEQNLNLSLLKKLQAGEARSPRSLRRMLTTPIATRRMAKMPKARRSRRLGIRENDEEDSPPPYEESEPEYYVSEEEGDDDDMEYTENDQEDGSDEDEEDDASSDGENETEEDSSESSDSSSDGSYEVARYTPYADDDVTIRAAERIAALELKVTALQARDTRRQVWGKHEKISEAPSLSEEDSSPVVQCIKSKKTSHKAKIIPNLYADAARRASQRRDMYRRERSAQRATEAEAELRSLKQKRRALSAPGPFLGLMQREEVMAKRKRERAAMIREAEYFKHRKAKFKSKPPPDFTKKIPFSSATKSNLKERAAAILAESDASAPRVARLSTATSTKSKTTRLEALKQKKKPLATRIKSYTPNKGHEKNLTAHTSSTNSSSRLATNTIKMSTRSRINNQRDRWDAYLQFYRQHYTTNTLASTQTFHTKCCENKSTAPHAKSSNKTDVTDENAAPSASSSNNK